MSGGTPVYNALGEMRTGTLATDNQSAITDLSADGTALDGTTGGFVVDGNSHIHFFIKPGANVTDYDIWFMLSDTAEGAFWYPACDSAGAVQKFEGVSTRTSAIVMTGAAKLARAVLEARTTGAGGETDVDVTGVPFNQ